MKKKWPYYLGCIIVPHIMLVVGLIFLTKQNMAWRNLGKRLCLFSTLVLIIGSLIYYILFTPIFGLD